MAKARKTRGRTKAKGAAGRKRSAKAGRKATRRAGAGASKKLAELQAQNRRLRDEISALREQLASRTAAAGEDGGVNDRQPTLGL